MMYNDDDDEEEEEEEEEKEKTVVKYTGYFWVQNRHPDGRTTTGAKRM
jgi:hypothetical protein